MVLGPEISHYSVPWFLSGLFGSQYENSILNRFGSVEAAEKIQNCHKGAFKDYVYKILAFFDHLPPWFTFLWYKSLQKVDLFDHLPPFSCKRSLWTALKHATFEGRAFFHCFMGKQKHSDYKLCSITHYKARSKIRLLVEFQNSI